MVGKKSSKVIAKEEGLERTDNNLGLTTWPLVAPINQKNYYTEYLKRDDQFLCYRLQHEEARNRMAREARDRDRALAQTSSGVALADTTSMSMDIDAANNAQDAVSSQEVVGSKVVVIHPGSQNLRIGLASDALPKTIPMVIARKLPENQIEDSSEEPKPKRHKIDGEIPEEPEKWFGEEFASRYTQMCAELKIRMRNHKLRVLPNSKELVVNYNRRTSPDIIPEHNDPHRIDWTELPSDPSQAPTFITGHEALRIADDSSPKYRLFWPIRHGWVNEKDYDNKSSLYQDLATIFEEAIKTQIGLRGRKEWAQYGCIFIVPDLYDRAYVTTILDMFLREIGFGRVTFLQESLAASFGAGYSISCIVDIGAQKTSISCVDEGTCIENSRVNLKYGGADITDLFMKMMLFDHFPYADIDLSRQYDAQIAEELKQKVCTMNEADVTVQLYDFHVRVSGQSTRKYQFKTYDETLLAPMGYFKPAILDAFWKLNRRRKLIERSYDIYDGAPNDPLSNAQQSVIDYAGSEGQSGSSVSDYLSGLPSELAPSRRPAHNLNLISRLGDLENTPRSSVAGSPAPETPQPQNGPVGVNGEALAVPQADPINEAISAAMERDRILPIMPLDAAIITSISQGSRGDDRKMRDFFGGIMVIGGGSKHPGFLGYLENRLREAQPGLQKEILIGSPPRDLDPQVLAWKGGSVFAKVNVVNECWIGQLEYDRLGSRALTYKCFWNW